MNINKMSKHNIQVEICIQDTSLLKCVEEYIYPSRNITLLNKMLIRASYPVILVPGNSIVDDNEHGTSGIIMSALMNYYSDNLVNTVKALAKEQYDSTIPIGKSLLVKIDHIEVPENEIKLYDTEKYTHIVYMPLKSKVNHHITLENLKLGLHSMLTTCYENNITHISMPILSVVAYAELEEIVNTIQEVVNNFNIPIR
jgi:hypothetical protein